VLPFLRCASTVEKQEARMKVYVLWDDYDGSYLESFDTRDEAAIKAGEIVAKQNSSDDYGTSLLGVVEGFSLDVHIVSRIDAVELRDKEDE